MKFVIIYLWQGERHRSDVFTDATDAHNVAKEYRAKGFSAWVETL